MFNSGNWVWQTVVGIFVVSGVLTTWILGARRLIRRRRKRRRQTLIHARQAAAAATAAALASGPDPALTPASAATEQPTEQPEPPEAAATGVDRSTHEPPISSEASFYTTRTHRGERSSAADQDV
ncbi:MAG: hypothetical protein Q9184_000779 [Pyrenodesmia sp. 2 TL-2023]